MRRHDGTARRPRTDSRSISPGRVVREDAPTWLSLVTGLDGDRREPLNRDHSLFDAARRAFERQDGWTDEQHQAAFELLFESWPRKRGVQSISDLQVSWAVSLMRDSFAPAEIAHMLGVKCDTLRKRRIIDRAEMFIDEQLLGQARPPKLRLPRVFESYITELDQVPGQEDESPVPRFWINLPPGSIRDSPARRKLDQKVKQRLRRLWECDRAATASRRGD